MDPFELDPSQPPPPIIERAYELAASGKFACVPEICDRLIAEGYEEVFLHFEGRASTRADLLRICRHAQGEAAKLGMISSNQSATADRPRLTNARRFELKSAECRQLADNAGYDETRQIFMRLACTYDRLANQAEQNEQDDAAKRKSSGQER
jgi:hypothetical protein